MSDWAEKVAEKLCWDDVGPFVSQSDVTAALRKAREDALKEAAEAAASFATCGCKERGGRCPINDIPLKISDAILSLKDKQP